MKNIIEMSLFMPPISPIRDKATGKTLKNATLTPLRTVRLEDVYQLITSSERLVTLTLEVRNAAQRGDENACRQLKQQTLPYVTPCGVFTRRRSDCLVESSGLVVVDIDHLKSVEEAETLRRQLFDDPYLCPALVFISPTGRGVKAFVPCSFEQNAAEGVRRAMDYVHCMYDADGLQTGKGVDTSGKDPVRACFLCHDSGALIRNQKFKIINPKNQNSNGFIIIIAPPGRSRQKCRSRHRSHLSRVYPTGLCHRHRLRRSRPQ